jgi:hypothetical protein
MDYDYLRRDYEIKKFSIETVLKAMSDSVWTINDVLTNAKMVEKYFKNQEPEATKLEEKPSKQTTTYTHTHSDLLGFIKCVDDPSYFIENYCSIQSALPGSTAFTLRQYQKTWLESIRSEKRLLIRAGRQTGLTYTLAASVLHKALFFPDQCIMICTGNYRAAIDFLDRIRFMYDDLPEHIRHGITQNNKGTISFDNGSRIIGRVASEQAGRGLTLNTIIIDNAENISWSALEGLITSITPCIEVCNGQMIVASTNDTVIDADGPFLKLFDSPFWAKTPYIGKLNG